MIVLLYFPFTLITLASAGVKDAKILLGDNIPIQEQPYIVIYGSHSGIIVNSDWILTCALCGTRNFIKAKGTTVLFGDGEIIWIAKHVKHTKFDEKKKIFDFQLLKLKRKIVFDDRAQPAKIVYDQSSVTVGITGNTLAVNISGWGYVKSEHLDIITEADLLKRAELPIVRCPRDYGDGSFCMGFKYIDRGLCVGDEGGPVVMKDRVIGMAVHDIECPTKTQQRAGNVSVIKDWVIQTTSSKLSMSRGSECTC